MMGKQDITGMQGAPRSLKEQHALLVISDELDPVYEISGIDKILENGPLMHRSCFIPAVTKGKCVPRLERGT